MMNVLRRIAMAIGGTVVVALVIGLAAPKTVRAVVSALVTVANTSSNPVPVQSVDNPALQPFQASASCTADNSGSCQADQFLLIPSGMTAVMQYFSGECRIGNSDIAPVNVFLFGVNGDGTTGGVIRITVTGPPLLGEVGHYTFGGPATLYATSTSGAQARFGFESRLLGGGNCDVNIIGYYVKNGL